MNPLTVNPAIVLDQALRAVPAKRVTNARRSRRTDRATRSARTTVERSGL